MTLPLVDDLATFVARRREPVALVVAPLHAGSRGPSEARVRHRGGALRRRRAPRQARRGARSNVDAMLRDLSEVRIGDPVVHEQHGIGRYLGLVTLDLGEGPAEFLQLDYANDAKLYVPVAEPASDRALQRRVARGRAAARARQRPMGQGEEARGARRRTTPPRSCSTCTRSAPRARATRSRSSRTTTRPSPTASVRGNARPAGRHRGGDQRPDRRQADGPAGLRRRRLRQDRSGAARGVRRAADGKQVAVLVPTTLLAEQHFQMFSDRFADLPVKLVELSRFRSPKEVKAGARRARGRHASTS